MYLQRVPSTEHRVSATAPTTTGCEYETLLLERSAARAEKAIAQCRVRLDRGASLAPAFRELTRRFVHYAAMLHTLVQTIDLQRQSILLKLGRRIESGC